MVPTSARTAQRHHPPVRSSSDRAPDAAAFSPAVIGDDPARPTSASERSWPSELTVGLARIAAGFVFGWAFADKLLGLGYATPAARAWVAGGSPTAGFLGHLEAGPLAGPFRGLAGNPVVDWVFMIGLLAIGLALLAGVGVRIAAVSGSVMLALMWLAEWPPARVTAAGDPTGSANPLIDSHIVLIALLCCLAVVSAGRHLGLGRWWERLVGRRRWLV